MTRLAPARSLGLMFTPGRISLHDLRDRFPGDDLAVVAEIGEDLWRSGHFIGAAVEPDHFLLDPLGPDRPVRRFPPQPGIESGPRYLQQPSHPFDREVVLLHPHQLERTTRVSDASSREEEGGFF